MRLILPTASLVDAAVAEKFVTVNGTTSQDFLRIGFFDLGA
jgi:hypothetical protein